MLGRLFGPKREELMEGRRKLHSEECGDVYFSPNVTTLITGTCATHGGKWNVYRTGVPNPERIKCTLNKWRGRVTPGLNWLRIWTTNELLWIRQ